MYEQKLIYTPKKVFWKLYTDKKSRSLMKSPVTYYIDRSKSENKVFLTQNHRYYAQFQYETIISNTLKQPQRYTCRITWNTSMILLLAVNTIFFNWKCCKM